MFLRRFTDFVLQSRVQAMATAFIIAFIPLIGSISILIAALVTLRKGILEGAFVTVAATLPYVIGYYVSAPPTDQAIMMFGMIGVIIASNVLTWLFAVVLRQFSNWNFTFELAALLGVLAIGIVHLVYPDIQNWWAAQLTAYFAKTADTVGKFSPGVSGQAAIPSDVQMQAVATMKQLATGFIVVSILFNAMLQLLIARWWQAVMFNPGGLRKELYQIRLSHIAGAVFVIGFALAYLGSDLAIDMMPVIFAVFFAAGLSVIHKMISLTKNGWIWLFLIYLGIIWLFPVSIAIVAMVALLDTGIDIRKRFNL